MCRTTALPSVIALPCGTRIASPCSGHFALEDKGQEIAALMLDFLAKESQAASPVEPDQSR
jgi:hypothetical protein